MGRCDVCALVLFSRLAALFALAAEVGELLPRPPRGHVDVRDLERCASPTHGSPYAERLPADIILATRESGSRTYPTIGRLRFAMSSCLQAPDSIVGWLR